MSLSMLALIAFIPIAMVLVLMVGFRWPATKAMPLSWLACALIGATMWQMPGGACCRLNPQRLWQCRQCIDHCVSAPF